MNSLLDHDVTLPGGVLVQIRPAQAADAREIEPLMGSTPPPGARVLVAHRPWGGPLAAAGWWVRHAGPRGRAAVVRRA